MKYCFFSGLEKLNKVFLMRCSIMFTTNFEVNVFSWWNKFTSSASEVCDVKQIVFFWKRYSQITNFVEIFGFPTEHIINFFFVCYFSPSLSTPEAICWAVWRPLSPRPFFKVSYSCIMYLQFLYCQWWSFPYLQLVISFKLLWRKKNRSEANIKLFLHECMTFQNLSKKIIQSGITFILWIK